MKKTFEPLVIWGDGFSTLNSWFIHCATPESCYELIKGVVKGDPDRQLVLEDPLEKTAHWDINCDGYYPFCSHCGEAAQHMSRFCPNCGRGMITRRHEDA